MVAGSAVTQGLVPGSGTLLVGSFPAHLDSISQPTIITTTTSPRCRRPTWRRALRAKARHLPWPDLLLGSIATAGATPIAPCERVVPRSCWRFQPTATQSSPSPGDIATTGLSEASAHFLPETSDSRTSCPACQVRLSPLGAWLPEVRVSNRRSRSSVCRSRRVHLAPLQERTPRRVRHRGNMRQDKGASHA